MPPTPPPNSTVAELASVLGDESARELAAMFLTSFPAVLKELGSPVREERKRAAHSLKSSSRIVGASALSERMSELEARLTNTNADVTPADLAATIADFEVIAVPLRAYAHPSG